MSIADKLRTARELIAHGMNHTGTSTHHYKMMSQALAALPDPEEIAMVEDLAESCVPKAAEMARLVRERDELRDELKWLYAKLYSAHEDLRQAGVPVSSVTYIRKTEKGNLTRLRKEEEA